MKNYSRKVTKTGNSLSITLPPDVLETLKLSQGDSVVLALEGDKVCLAKQSPVSLTGDLSDEDFMAGLEAIVAEHGNTLKEMA